VTNLHRDRAYVTDPVIWDSGATYTPGISERRNGVSTFLHGGLKDVQTQTDSSGNVVATRKYDAYGMVTNSTGVWKGPFGYSGGAGYQEDETGLQLLGHRYYDASTGRFLTRDPIKDGRNWYSYCDNNPVTRVDPNGLDWFNNASKFMAGRGDTLTFGSTAVVRGWMGVDIVDTESSAYLGGSAVGTVHGLVIPGMGAAKAAKAGSKVIGSAFRTAKTLRQVINVVFSPRSLQHAFKHAKDFGIPGNWNNANRAKFLSALQKFVSNPSNVIKNVAYKGVKGHRAIVNPATGQAVIVDEMGIS
jgi:RHS repeat-associated protein